MQIEYDPNLEALCLKNYASLAGFGHLLKTKQSSSYLNAHGLRKRATIQLW